jgi:capsular polysaccharide biosynthesis protein
VRDRDAVIAQSLADALARTFVSEVQNFQPPQQAGPGTLPTLPAYVFETATLPTAPASNHLLSHLVLGGLLGLVLSVGVVLLLDYIDITVKAPTDIERRVHLPVLGVVPMQRQLTSNILPPTARQRRGVSTIDV